jgi:hypothetical protein
MLTSCQTYHIGRQELLEQFANSPTEKKQMPLPIGIMGLFFPGVVDGNALTDVKVYDKTGKPVIIHLTDHTGVRITKSDSSRVTFMFNTFQIKDSTITGSKSHFVEWRFTPIKLKDVVRIEVQK